jgi:hypothetical protein
MVRLPLMLRRTFQGNLGWSRFDRWADVYRNYAIASPRAVSTGSVSVYEGFVACGLCAETSVVT